VRGGVSLRGVIVLVFSISGCAVFSGYTPELAQTPLPPELRDRGAPAPGVVPLQAPVEETAPVGFVSTRRASIDQVVEVARQHSNQVLQAAARIEVASGRVQSADGALLPGIDARVAGSYLDGRQIGSFGDQRDGVSFGRFEPSVGVYYRVNPAAAYVRTEQFRREADAAAHDLREAERTAMLQAGVGYLDLALNYASQQIALSLVGDAERFVAIALARERAQIAGGADVARAQASVARAKQVAVRMRGQWEGASIRLATLLRWPTDELLLPADSDLHPTSLIDAMAGARLYEEAEISRPDIRAARARRAAADKEVLAAWWDLLGPEVDVTLRERWLGTQVSDLDSTHLVNGLVGFSFDFGELGRARTAEGNARLVEIREQTIRERARGEIEAAITKVRTMGETIPEARSSVEAAERSYDIQLARFRAGTGLGIEVIEAQITQARARLALATAIVRYNAAQVELAASIGHLRAELLAASEQPSSSAAAVTGAVNDAGPR